MVEKYGLADRAVNYTDGAKYHWAKEPMEFKDSHLLGTGF